MADSSEDESVVDIRQCCNNKQKCWKYVVENIFMVSSLVAVVLGKFVTSVLTFMIAKTFQSRSLENSNFKNNETLNAYLPGGNCIHELY